MRFLLALFLSSCSQVAGPKCDVHFSGNVVDTATMGSCASIDHDGGGNVLELSASSSMIARLSVSIDLGSAITTGQFSSATVANWSASALRNDNSNCAYIAGSQGMQTGSFTLDISTVQGSIVHGRFVSTLYVHAPPMIACGTGDIEQVTIDF
jgi:hypothetical protein